VTEDDPQRARSEGARGGHVIDLAQAQELGAHQAGPQHVVYEVGGASSPEDSFQRKRHEWGHVISGLLSVRIGFREYLLEPGDSISLDSTTPHRLASAGDTPVHAIWFVLGRDAFDDALPVAPAES